MKRIGITARLLETSEYPEIREALDVRWGIFLDKADIIPILIPLSFNNFSCYFNELKIEGLLLTGGNDLFIWSNNQISLLRDQFELQLIDLAIKNALPILGVCRGAQLLLKKFNGEFSRRKSHVANRHSLNINNRSRFYNIFQGHLEVNSYHHHCIDALSCNLNVIANSNDGSVEAFEHKSLNILGVMWHPEREDPISYNDIKLFREFFK